MNIKRPLMVIAAGFVFGEVLILSCRAVWLWILLLMAMAVGAGGFQAHLEKWKGMGRNTVRKRQSRSAIWRTFLLLFFLLAAVLAGYERGAAVKRRLDLEEEQAVRLGEGKVTVCGRIGSVEEKEGSVRLVLEGAVVRDTSDRETVTEKMKFRKIWVYLAGEEEENEETYHVPENGNEYGGEKEREKNSSGPKARNNGSSQGPGKEKAAELVAGKRAAITGELEAIEGPRNPGEFDFRGYYRAKGIGCRLFADCVEMVEGEASPYFRFLNSVKSRCRTVLEEVCQEADSMIYKAVLLGERTSMDIEVKTMYQRAGIAHLLAISGQHLTIIGGGIYLILRRIGLGYKKAGAIGAVLVVSYCVLTGGSGSALRAVIMILCLWMAAACGRTYDTLSALSLSAMLLLWESPYLLFQSGFQLSFGAVYAIGGIGSFLCTSLKAEKAWQKTLLISLCVQLALAPVMLWHYYQYPLYGILMNLLVLPLVPMLMYSGLLAIGIGSFFRAGGVAAVGAGHYIMEYYSRLCGLAEQLPGYCLVLGRPGLGQVGGYYICVAVLLRGIAVLSAGNTPARFSELVHPARRLFCFPSVCAVFALSFLLLLPRSVKGLEILCMDVGQGDGFVLMTGRHAVLIDGGSSSEKKLGSMSLEPYLKSRGVTSIDYAVVSHGDNDHISGLRYLLEESEDIKIKTLVLPSKGQEEEIYCELGELQQKNGGKVVHMETGSTIRAGNLQLFCLYAGEDSPSADRNSHSLVLCADYEGFHMLFTGDMGTEEESVLLELAERSPFQREHLNHVQVLKLAHHGSAGSSSQPFVEQMPLRLAIVSYGKGNSYGHPSQKVMESMQASKIPVMETGKGGAVLLKTDGIRLSAHYIFHQK